MIRPLHAAAAAINLRHALSVLFAISLAALAVVSSAETVYTLSVTGTVGGGGCSEPDGCAAVVNPVPNGSLVAGNIDFVIVDPSIPEVTILDSSFFSVGGNVVDIEGFTPSNVGPLFLAGFNRWRWRLEPDPAALINSGTASTYDINFIYSDGVLPSDDFMTSLDLLTINNLNTGPSFNPTSGMTLFHPPNILVTLDSVNLTSVTTATPEPVAGPGGALLGATSIDVGGTLYDVAFVDGTCADVFGTCEATGFLFMSLTESQAANTSLLQQIFSSDPYQDAPSLINGCESPSECAICTPYEDIGGATVVGRRLIVRPGTEFLGECSESYLTDTTNAGSRVWAKWCLAGSGCVLEAQTGAENGIVGAWYNVFTPDPVPPDAGGPVLLNLLDNGQFMFGQDGDTMADPNGMDGIEWGYYTFDGTTIHFDTQLDTNGEWGPESDSFSAVLDGNTLTLDGNFVLNRVDSDGLVGGWLANGIVDDQSVSLTFIDDGSFMLLHGNNPGDPNGQAGLEFGTYMYDQVTGNVTYTVVTDTNGEFGISDPQAQQGLSVAGDVLTFLEGGTPQATFSRILAGDDDSDGINNVMDNCVAASNADQNDSNEDGFGNLCDTDISGDCTTNALDLGLFKQVFFSADADADFNGDGVVNATDLGIMKSRFFDPPGPSYQTLSCR